MFHTSLLTKNLLFCLVGFSFSWGFNAVNLPNNVSACMIEEEDEDDPEEEQEPYAELINKEYRINAGLVAPWKGVPDSEELTAKNFSQKNGSAKLEARCDTRMVVPANTLGYKFKVILEVKDEGGNSIMISSQEYTRPPGTTYTVNNQTVLQDGYTGNKMTVIYKVYMKEDVLGSQYPASPVTKWQMIFNKL